jgi:flagellin
MALIIPPNGSSPSLGAELGVNQAGKTAGKGVPKVQPEGTAPAPVDDGAGLAVSDAARIRLRSLASAERQANEGISMAQTADGALGRMGGLLERMRDLALNEGDDDSGSENAKLEFSKLKAELGGIQKSTTYEGHALLGAERVEIGFDLAAEGGAGDRLTVTLGGLAPLSALTASASPLSGAGGEGDSLVGRIDDALGAISNQRARFGAAVNRFADTAAAVQTARSSRMAGSTPLSNAAAAEELANLVKTQIFGQGQGALVTQAHQLSSHAQSLLQD